MKHITDTNDATEVTDDENEMEEILEENEDEDPDWSGEALQDDEDDDEDDAEELDDNDDPEWGPKNEDIPGIHKFCAIFRNKNSKFKSNLMLRWVWLIRNQRSCVLGKANPASVGISSDKLKPSSDKKLLSSTTDSSNKGSNKTSTKFDTNRKRKSSSSSPFNTKNAKS